MHVYRLATRNRVTLNMQAYRILNGSAMLDDRMLKNVIPNQTLSFIVILDLENILHRHVCSVAASMTSYTVSNGASATVDKRYQRLLLGQRGRKAKVRSARA